MSQVEITKHEGTIATLGTHTVNSGGVVYQYIRMESDDGKEIYLTNVICPNRLDSYLGVGIKASISICEFGVKNMKRSVLFAVNTNDKLVEDIDGVIATMKFFKMSKAFCMTQIIIGIPLIPFFFIGVFVIVTGMRNLNSVFDIPERGVFEGAVSN